MLIRSVTKAAHILLLSSFLLSEVVATPDQSDLVNRAKALLKPWATLTAPGVGVAVSVNSKIALAESAGLANLEHQKAIETDSIFQVASISKQFTAFAVLLLVSEGRIALDDDIRSYLPELFPTQPPITVRHLLDHTSGLRELSSLAEMAGWLADDIRTWDQMMILVARQRGVNFPAGKRVEYSNTGYALLAEIIARVSDQTFQAFTRTRIFEPLGMTLTRFAASRNDLITGRASSYYPQDEGFKNVVANNELVGSTGLHTTTRDLLIWADNFKSRKVGNKQVFSLLAERTKALNGEDATFGRGQELKTYKGLETWSHGGRDAGYRAFLLRVPIAGFAVSIVSNRTDFDAAKLAYALADLFLEGTPGFEAQPPMPWQPATEQELASYAGHYEYFPGLILTITTDEDGLKLSNLGAPTTDLPPLQQIGRRRFLLNPQADISINFAAPENELSPGFGYTIGLHGTLNLPRVGLLPFDAASIEVCDYAGVYESTELATRYHLTCEGGELVARHIRRPAIFLKPYQSDTFAALSGPLRQLLFTRDDAGKITGITAAGPLAEGVRFRRLSTKNAADEP